jgi:hypothetical protein
VLDASNTTRAIGLTFNSAGSISNSVNLLALGNPMLAGEGLSGESLNDGNAVSLAYSATVFDHADASFGAASDPDQNVLSLVLGSNLFIDQTAASGFSLSNLLGNRVGLQFVSIVETSDASGLFTGAGAFSGLLGAGQSSSGDLATPFNVSFAGASALGTYTAQYTINLFDENLPGSVAQSLTLNVSATVGAIPEPASFTALGIAAAGLLMQRRPRARRRRGQKIA